MALLCLKSAIYLEGPFEDPSQPKLILDSIEVYLMAKPDMLDTVITENHREENETHSKEDYHSQQRAGLSYTKREVSQKIPKNWMKKG